MVKTLNIYDLNGTAVVNSIDVDLNNGSPLDNALNLILRNNTGQSVAEAQGGATKYPVDIPYTTKTAAYFNHWQTQSIQQGNEANRRKFVLYLDNVPRRSGEVQLVSATKSKAKLTLYLDNNELFRTIQNTKLWELFNTSDWNLDYDSTAIDITTGQNYVNGSSEFCYVPVKARSWELSSGKRVVTEKDHWIVISAKAVFDALMLRLNPVGSWTSVFMQQYVWQRVGFFVNTARQYERSVINSLYSARASSAAAFSLVMLPPIPTPSTWTDLEEITDDSTAPNFDQGGIYDGTTQTFTAPIDANYTFKFHFEYSVGIPSGVEPLLIVRPLINGTPSTAIGGGLLQSEFELPAQTLQAGDTVFFQYMLINTNVAIVSPTSLDFEYVNIEISIAEKAFNGTILVPALMPESWTVSKFLSAFFGMFNMRCYFNADTRAFQFEPYRPWQEGGLGSTQYSGWLSRTIDMTENVNLEQSEVSVNRDSLFVQFDFESNPDATNEANDKAQIIPTGAARWEVVSRQDRERANYTLPCGKINHILDSTLVPDPTTDPAPYYQAPYLPLIYSEVHNLNESDVDFNETDALMFCFVRIAGSNVRMKLNGGSTVEGVGVLSAYQVYLAGTIFEPASGVYYSNKSLVFSDYLGNNGQVIPGLMRRFYVEGLSGAANGKRFEALATVSGDIVQTHDTRSLWKIGNNVYEVEQIEYNPDNASHPVLLIEHAAAENAEANIFNSEIQPLVIYG